MALLHLRSRACPSPGTSHPATAAASASAGLIEFFCVSAIYSGKQRENAGLHGSGDARFLSVYIHVHLTADAELFEIDPRFDGKAGTWQNRTQIVRFEAIHIRAVTVHFLSDAVAGAVHKV